MLKLEMELTLSEWESISEALGHTGRAYMSGFMTTLRDKIDVQLRDAHARVDRARRRGDCTVALGVVPGVAPPIPAPGGFAPPPDFDD